jgi:hypothetical protein
MAYLRLSHPEYRKLNMTSKNIINVKMPAPRFVTFRLKDTEKTVRNINPFCIQKTLDNIADKVINAVHVVTGG